MKTTYDVRFIIRRTYVYEYVVEAESEGDAEGRANDMHFEGPSNLFTDDHCVDEETTDWETVINAR